MTERLDAAVGAGASLIGASALGAYALNRRTAASAAIRASTAALQPVITNLAAAADDSVGEQDRVRINSIIDLLSEDPAGLTPTGANRLNELAYGLTEATRGYLLTAVRMVAASPDDVPSFQPPV